MAAEGGRASLGSGGSGGWGVRRRGRRALRVRGHPGKEPAPGPRRFPPPRRTLRRGRAGCWRPSRSRGGGRWPRLVGSGGGSCSWARWGTRSSRPSSSWPSAGTASAVTLLFFTYPVWVAVLSALLGMGLPGWLVGGRSSPPWPGPRWWWPPAGASTSARRASASPWASAVTFLLPAGRRRAGLPDPVDLRDVGERQRSAGARDVLPGRRGGAVPRASRNGSR